MYNNSSFQDLQNRYGSDWRRLLAELPYEPYVRATPRSLTPELPYDPYVRATPRTLTPEPPYDTTPPPELPSNIGPVYGTNHVETFTPTQQAAGREFAANAMSQGLKAQTQIRNQRNEAGRQFAADAMASGSSAKPSFVTSPQRNLGQRLSGLFPAVRQNISNFDQQFPGDRQFLSQAVRERNRKYAVAEERRILEGTMPLPRNWKPSGLTDEAQRMDEDRRIVESVPTFEERLGIGQVPFDPVKHSGLRDGGGQPAFYQAEIDRLDALSADYGGALAYDQVMRGGRPAYEVTGDKNISPYWRNRAYNDTPVKTEAQRQDQRRRAQSLYGGHQQRQSFDTLNSKDDTHRNYMSRKFKEAGASDVKPEDMTEENYQAARDKKADAYAERRKKRRKRIADSVSSSYSSRLRAAEYNKNRGQHGFVPKAPKRFSFSR